MAKEGTRGNIAWKFFKTYQFDQKLVNCTICLKDLIYCSSTSDLTRHLDSQHPVEYKAAKTIDNTKRIGGSGKSMTDYLVTSDTTTSCEEATVRFLVETYQPYSAVENPFFRAMIKAHNPKAKDMSAKHAKKLVKDKVEIFKAVADEIMQKQRGALTCDGWTSKQDISYCGFTFHYIEKITWKLNPISLGIEHHDGRSTAEDHYAELVVELTKHGLTWENIVAIVTDTEPTMNALGRMVEERAMEAGYVVEHVG